MLTYDDARSRAGQIAEVTQSRFMPPWLPEDGHEPLAGDRRLSDDEIEVLAEWVGGSARGRSERLAAVRRMFHSGWQLGEPDLVLESPPFELPADGPDRFRNFVLPVPADADDRWVRAVEIRPLIPRQPIMLGWGSMPTTNRSAAMRPTPKPGYEGMAWGEDPGGQLITWTPGMTPDAGTPGAGLATARPTTKLVLHTHLQPSGKRETDRFPLGLLFRRCAADAASV